MQAPQTFSPSGGSKRGNGPLDAMENFLGVTSLTGNYQIVNNCNNTCYAIKSMWNIGNRQQ